MTTTLPPLPCGGIIWTRRADRLVLFSDGGAFREVRRYGSVAAWRAAINEATNAGWRWDNKPKR